MSFTDNFGHPRGLLGHLMLICMEREHRPMAEWGFAQFKIPENADVLDIGCGGGYNLKRILERCPNGKAYGLDISEESVKRAKAVNKRELGKRVEIIRGGVEKMPFQDARFDLATAFETVFFWPDPAGNFKEVYRVLKAGGSFAVINNYGDPKIDWEKKIPCMTRYTAERIASFLSGSGFINVKISQKGNLFCVIGQKA